MGLHAQNASPIASLQSPPPNLAGTHNHEGDIRVSGGVMAGLLVTRIEPVYPADTEAQGAVVLHAIIGADGRVAKLTVVAGPAMLRDAAVEAVRQWVYKPYLLNGQPVSVDTTVVVNFRR